MALSPTAGGSTGSPHEGGSVGGAQGFTPISAGAGIASPTLEVPINFPREKESPEAMEVSAHCSTLIHFHFHVEN